MITRLQSFLLALMVLSFLQVGCIDRSERDAPVTERLAALEIGGPSLTNIRSLVAGSNETCAVTGDGRAWCWGYNDFGGLGNGTTLPSGRPIAVAGLPPAASVTIGLWNACAALVDGTVRCWGFNGYGQLGNGSTTDSHTPVAVVGLGGVVSLASGWGHTCALLVDRTVRCWGAGSNGQLGNGGTADSPVPVAVTGLSGVASLTVNGYHTCALLTDGTARCWGRNTDGELGNGGTADSPVPVPVAGLANVASLSAGGWFTCAKLADRTATCWGRGGDGALGNGGTSSSPTPVPVSGLAGVATLSPGGYHVCASLEDGTARCWGFGGYGQVGGGTTTSSATPTAVVGLSGVASISAGGLHSCALLTDGTARCWGSAADGELGNGGTVESTTPITVAGLSGAASLAASLAHTCAILGDGTVRCWGENTGAFDGTAGQLGNGDNTGSFSPVVVSGLSGAVSLAGGETHTCALLTDGTARCWGDNDDGELGDGRTSPSSVPVAASGLTGLAALAAGNEFTCAILADRRVLCWGFNGQGDLGNGATTTSLTPVEVTGLTNVASLAAGRFFACATLFDGTARCWGEGIIWGALGNGQLVDSPVPVVVSGLTGAASVVAGENYACALLTDGTARCWGDNRDGELGNGTFVNSSTPVVVGGLTNIVSLAARWRHTCAILSDRTARCWGNNEYGQLGDGSTVSSATPVPVAGLAGVRSITVGSSYSCAALMDGSTRCWGSNRRLQLGSFNSMKEPAPVHVLSGGTGGNGQTCAGPNDCTSGFCVDNVCCDGACGGSDTGDCQACAVATGASANGTCTTLSSAHVCRARADACDIAESCNGGLTCPADAKFPSCTTEPVSTCTNCNPIAVDGGALGDINVGFNGSVASSGTIASVQGGTGSPPGPLPTGYKVLNGSTGLYYFDLNTTATYSGPIVVCLNYAQGTLKEGCDDTTIPIPSNSELKLRLLHDEGHGFVDITVPFVSHSASAQVSDPCVNRICGQTRSLSPFVIVEPIDTDAPIITGAADVVAYATTITGATGTYLLPTATDGFDGPVPVSCTPPPEATFAPGRTPVMCTASDAAENTAPASFTVWVQYHAPADGSFFLQPINSDGSSVFKRGSTVPVKFKLQGASAGITNLAAHLSIAKVSSNVTGDYLEAASTCAADAGSTFRYDPAAHQYIFNLSTKGMTVGTWSLRAELGDLVEHTVNVSLR